MSRFAVRRRKEREHSVLPGRRTILVAKGRYYEMIIDAIGARPFSAKRGILRGARCDVERGNRHARTQTRTSARRRHRAIGIRRRARDNCTRRDDRKTYDCTRRANSRRGAPLRAAPLVAVAFAALFVSSRRVAVARRDERKTEQRVFLRASGNRRFLANERNRHDHPPHRPAKRSTGCRAPLCAAPRKGATGFANRPRNGGRDLREEVFFVGFLLRGRERGFLVRSSRETRRYPMMKTLDENLPRRQKSIIMNIFLFDRI